MILNKKWRDNQRWRHNKIKRIKGLSSALKLSLCTSPGMVEPRGFVIEEITQKRIRKSMRNNRKMSYPYQSLHHELSNWESICTISNKLLLIIRKGRRVGKYQVKYKCKRYHNPYNVHNKLLPWNIWIFVIRFSMSLLKAHCINLFNKRGSAVNNFLSGLIQSSRVHFLHSIWASMRCSFQVHSINPHCVSFNNWWRRNSVKSWSQYYIVKLLGQQIEKIRSK